MCVSFPFCDESFLIATQLTEVAQFLLLLQSFFSFSSCSWSGMLFYQWRLDCVVLEVNVEDLLKVHEEWTTKKVLVSRSSQLHSFTGRNHSYGKLQYFFGKMQLKLSQKNTSAENSEIRYPFLNEDGNSWCVGII